MGTDPPGHRRSGRLPVLFDARDGIQPYDEHFADLVRQSGKPVILLANKCEGRLQEDSVHEAYRLGLGEPIPFSAEHGLGLLDLYEALKPFDKKEEKTEPEFIDFEGLSEEEINAVLDEKLRPSLFSWRLSGGRMWENQLWSMPC